MTMKVARLHASGDLRLAEEPAPESRPGWTRIAVGAVGLCGSDLHWYTEGGIGDARLERPVVPGHEMGGVALDGPYAGRVVAIDPSIPCNRCEHCREGNPNLCEHQDFAGHGDFDGGLREELIWPTDRLYPMPDGVDAAAASVLEPLGVAIHAWDLAHVRLADRVAVVGCGPIGLLLVQLAASLGAREVWAVEPLAHRREAAARYGADLVLTPDQAREQPPASCEVVFEVHGGPDAVELSMQLARGGGRVALVGIPDVDRTSFTASVARRKGLTLVCVRRMQEVYARAASAVERGHVDLDSLVSDRYPLAEAAAGFEFAARRGGLKTVIEI